MRSSRSAAARCRLTPCTSSVELRRSAARANGPCVTRQRAPSRRTRRDSTSGLAASAKQLLTRGHAAEAGQRAAHQQGLLLPVAAQKILRRQAP